MTVCIMPFFSQRHCHASGSRRYQREELPIKGSFTSSQLTNHAFRHRQAFPRGTLLRSLSHPTHCLSFPVHISNFFSYQLNFQPSNSFRTYYLKSSWEYCSSSWSRSNSRIANSGQTWRQRQQERESRTVMSQLRCDLNTNAL